MLACSLVPQCLSKTPNIPCDILAPSWLDLLQRSNAAITYPLCEQSIIDFNPFLGFACLLIICDYIQC